MPLYWRLSGFYWFYFASLGALLPYWGPYLESIGFGPAQIGELTAVLMATRIVAPNLLGWVADRTGRRMSIVRWASLLAALAFAGTLLEPRLAWMALVVCLFSFFWNAALPQFEAVTLTHLGEAPHRYSQVRVWGSVGFIVAVVALGQAIGRFGVGLLPWVVLFLFLGIWAASLLVPGRAAVVHHHHGDPLWRVLVRPQVLSFLVVCFLMQAGHGPYYTFYTIYMEDHGYAPGLVGGFWALGVVAEVLVFLTMHRILRRFTARQVLLTSVALASTRWLLIAFFVQSLPVMAAAQLLHAASFGSYHAAAIHLVHRYFVGRHQGRGQALYSSISFGAGGAVGSLLAGYLWSAGAGSMGPTLAYLTAAVLSALAYLVSWVWVGRSNGRGRVVLAGRLNPRPDRAD
jgi:PPP family 3-phenylpropionic acid transporter